MPLSETQRNALTSMREMPRSRGSPTALAESVEERARRPAPESLPPDVTVDIEIAPPSLHQHPVLESTGVLKAPERVPVYVYSLSNSKANARSDPGLDSQDPKDIANTKVIFFIHGGGNVIGHPTIMAWTQYYVELLRAVASQSEGTAQCVLIAPSYRLATVPENVFPAALQDVVAAYDYILGKGYKASNIIIAGDSAGGNHAVVLTHLILRSSRPHPCGVVAIAPDSIHTHDHLSDYAKTLIGHDVRLSPRGLQRIWTMYVGESGVSSTDPLVSGCFLPFAADWPRTLILTGSADLMIDASRELKERIAALGSPVELVEYDEYPHGWWTMPELFPEDIQDFAERIGRFVLQG